MPGCWAEKVAATRVGSGAGCVATRMAAQRISWVVIELGRLERWLDG